MTINLLADIVVAIVTTVGIAVAISNATTAARDLYQRAQARAPKPRRGGAVPVLRPTQLDAGRDLVLP
jgi:outer membrane lipoprotein SlyB